GHHDGVIHCPVILQLLHHLGDRGTLLPDCAVNANQVVAFVVDDSVQNHGGLAGLAVADDQLALAAAARNHGIGGLDAGSHGLAYRLPVNHPGRDAFNRDVLAGRDRTFVVNRLAERVDHAADHTFTGRDGHDLARTLDLVALFDFGVLTHEHRAHL